MSKKLKITLASLACLLLAVLAVCLCLCGPKDVGSDKDTEKPTVTLSISMPTTGYNGETVALPAATATDNVDGNITDSVTVTVYALDETGAVAAVLINGKTANVGRFFTPKADYASYKIIYSVRDAAGNKTETAFDFTAKNRADGGGSGEPVSPDNDGEELEWDIV